MFRLTKQAEAQVRNLGQNRAKSSSRSGNLSEIRDSGGILRSAWPCRAAADPQRAGRARLSIYQLNLQFVDPYRVAHVRHSQFEAEESPDWSFMTNLNWKSDDVQIFRPTQQDYLNWMREVDHAKSVSSRI